MSSKIVFGILALAVVAVMVAIIAPNFARIRFASVREARAFGHLEDAEIVDELGDTNGPYTLKGAVVGGRNSEQFTFNLTFDGRTTNWTQAISNHLGFVATIFENRRGNQFAIVRRWKQ
jgi:hypothetical protein